jgi:hypothetical protein
MWALIIAAIGGFVFLPAGFADAACSNTGLSGTLIRTRRQ